MAVQPEWALAQGRAREQLGGWIDSSIKMHRAAPYHGIHDEGSFTASWDAYLFLTGDGGVRDFLLWLRDGFDAWGREHFHHGYYPEGEGHHATEAFTHFIARFRTLAPGDPDTARILDDAAHHLGNWEPGVPPWYDWDAHAMRSFRIGSRVVKAQPPDDYEEPDSIRPAMIGLAAFAVTRDERFLGFCLDYTDKWARALMEQPLPRVFFPRSPAAQYQDKLRERADADLLGRLELIVASGMVDFLLDLYWITGSSSYLDAAARVMAPQVDVAADPRNSVSAALLAKYRRLTGDTQFDADILDRLGKPPRFDSGRLSLLDKKEKPVSRQDGMLSNLTIGHRFDQVRWAEETGAENAEPTGAAWALAYQITGEEAFAARALFLAAERLRLAASKLDDGRDHGCAGYSTGAAASGHGRADRFGHVNSAFGPLALGSVRLFSAEEPLVVYPGGLPAGVSSLVRLAPTAQVTWHNANAEPVSFLWRDASSAGAPAANLTGLPPGETESARLGGAMPRGSRLGGQMPGVQPAG